MMNIPNLDAAESRVVVALVDAALAAGLTLSVYDSIDSEGAWVVKRSADRAAILSALASTEGDTLRFRNADGATVGHVVLVYGNGADVIADHTSNAATAALVARAGGAA